MDLSGFAEEVGAAGAVTITGACTRGGAVAGVRAVRAPAGVVEFLPEEMTVRCGAATPVDELTAVLAAEGQCHPLPDGGTVGGALAVGHSGVLRPARGAVRDALLQARYVNADGVVVKAGGPTVKNVSGFDLCRLLVGARGTLGFLGEVIVRTRPRPAVTMWLRTDHADPFVVPTLLFRPSAVLWDGTATWVCLEGHPADVAAQRALLDGAAEVEGPPPLPTGSRRSLPPTALRELTGTFVAEVGVGVVHHDDPWPDRPAPPAGVLSLNRRVKQLFDPAGRLNPGVDVLEAP